MIISIIVAISKNQVIGKNNQLIWHLPKDMKFFMDTTMDTIVIMGRKNYESIGRPLPGRTTIVLTKNKDYKVEGCHVVFSIEEGIALAKALDENELMIIGGGEIYNQTLPLTQKIYYTTVHFDFEGDTFYPSLSESEWELLTEDFHAADEKNKYDYTFKEYKRN